jgi:hypothetical protein
MLSAIANSALFRTSEDVLASLRIAVPAELALVRIISSIV